MCCGEHRDNTFLGRDLIDLEEGHHLILLRWLRPSAHTTGVLLLCAFWDPDFFQASPAKIAPGHKSNGGYCTGRDKGLSRKKTLPRRKVPRGQPPLVFQPRAGECFLDVYSYRQRRRVRMWRYLFWRLFLPLWQRGEGVESERGLRCCFLLGFIF